MSGFKPRTRKVELYQGDWDQRLDEAKRAAEEARDRDEVRSLDEAESEADRLARVHDDLREQAIEDRVVVTLQALGRRQWSEMVAANPPRVGDDVPEHIRKADEAIGVNDQALGEVLVPASIAGIEPDMRVDDLLEGISSAQFDLLYGHAFALNRGTGADPKAAPRLAPSQSSSGTGN